jgi:maltose alpha-D-glucosyltransferase/alpha-amylase
MHQPKPTDGVPLLSPDQPARLNPNSAAQTASPQSLSSFSQFRQRASRAFLRAYWEATDARSGPAARELLDLFLIEKAAYEIAYEATNWPTWIGVPSI